MLKKGVLLFALLLFLIPFIFATPYTRDANFFITSTGNGINGGDYNGLAGADQRCEDLARAGGFQTGDWKAYLSTSTENAFTRIGPGPFYNYRGQLIANSVDALHAAGISSNLIYDEMGRPILDSSGDSLIKTDHDIITGSTPDGKLSNTPNCNDVDSNDPNVFTIVGHADWSANDQVGVASWNAAHEISCDQAGLGSTGGSGKLYCFRFTGTAAGNSPPIPPAQPANVIRSCGLVSEGWQCNIGLTTCRIGNNVVLIYCDTLGGYCSSDSASGTVNCVTKKNDGSTCQSPVECTSNNCLNGICTAQAPAGGSILGTIGDFFLGLFRGVGCETSCYWEGGIVGIGQTKVEPNEQIVARASCLNDGRNLINIEEVTFNIQATNTNVITPYSRIGVDRGDAFLSLSFPSRDKYKFKVADSTGKELCDSTIPTSNIGVVVIEPETPTSPVPNIIRSCGLMSQGWGCTTTLMSCARSSATGISETIDCGANAYCAPDGSLVNINCVAKKVNGASCNFPAECISNNCANGICTAPPSNHLFRRDPLSGAACVVDSQCSIGYTCNLDLSTCVLSFSPPGGSCEIDANCYTPGNICLNFVCAEGTRCTTDANCPNGGTCSLPSGVCFERGRAATADVTATSGCSGDIDCVSGSVCVNSICVAAPPPADDGNINTDRDGGGSNRNRGGGALATCTSQGAQICSSTECVGAIDGVRSVPQGRCCTSCATTSFVPGQGTSFLTMRSCIDADNDGNFENVEVTCNPGATSFEQCSNSLISNDQAQLAGFENAFYKIYY